MIYLPWVNLNQARSLLAGQAWCTCSWWCARSLRVEHFASLAAAKTNTELRQSEKHPRAASALEEFLNGSLGRTPISSEAYDSHNLGNVKKAGNANIWRNARHPFFKPSKDQHPKSSNRPSAELWSEEAPESLPRDRLHLSRCVVLLRHNQRHRRRCPSDWKPLQIRALPPYENCLRTHVIQKLAVDDSQNK